MLSTEVSGICRSASMAALTALSLAFYDLYFILVALVSSLRALVASAAPAPTRNAAAGLQAGASSRRRPSLPGIARQARSR